MGGIVAGPLDVCKNILVARPKVFLKRTFSKASDLFDNFLFHFTYCLLFVFINGLSDKDLKRYSCNLFPCPEIPRRSFGARGRASGGARRRAAGELGWESVEGRSLLT